VLILLQSFQRVLIGLQKILLEKNQNGYEKTQNFIPSTKPLEKCKNDHQKNKNNVKVKAKKCALADYFAHNFFRMLFLVILLAVLKSA